MRWRRATTMLLLLLLSTPGGIAFGLNLNARVSFARPNVGAGSGAPRQVFGVRRLGLAGAMPRTEVARSVDADVCLWSRSSRHDGQSDSCRGLYKRRSPRHHTTSTSASLSNQHGKLAHREHKITNPISSHSHMNVSNRGGDGVVMMAWTGRRGVGSRGRRPTSLTASLASSLPATTATPFQTCSRLLGPESAFDGWPQSKRTKGTPDDGGVGGGGDGANGGGGGDGNGNGGGGGGDGRRRGSKGDHGDGATMANNSTMATPLLTANSFSLETGVDVDESLMKRSPLVRTLAPIFGFFQSRAGLYGMMLGYVMYTLSQHITPIYLGVSFLSVIGPSPARKLLVLGAQSLSFLTVASYVQDQFRHQVYPLQAVVAGPSAPYAVITGGSSGIGREVANELAGRGYNLLLVSRKKEGLVRAAKELREASRAAAEAAKREAEGGGGEASKIKPESKREKRRRRREERVEMKRRSSRSSAEEREHADSDMGSSCKFSKLVDVDGDGPEGGDGADEGSPPPHLANAIKVRWFAVDLTNSTAAAAVHEEVRRLNITVDVLVNAAGVCRVGKVETLGEEELNNQLQLNVVGTSLLTRLFAKDFVRRKKGRIMIVSSVTAAAPNPSVATYAASKSYLTSFAEALHSELEVSGVGVTCVMPGATRTGFEDNSGSTQALLWRLPLYVMEADEVAARGVEALMRGDRTVIPGWQNKAYVHVLVPLLPRKILMSLLQAVWR